MKLMARDYRQAERIRKRKGGCANVAIKILIINNKLTIATRENTAAERQKAFYS
jgi:hypothetical protein